MSVAPEPRCHGARARGSHSMEIHFEDADIDWLKAIDFDSPTLGVRDRRLQCRRISLPALEWSVFVFLSPVEHGLWLLREYQKLYESLHSFFSVQRNDEFGDDRAQLFESFLRRHRIPKNSEIAYRCFGMYPRFWGHRFSPRYLKGSVSHRLLSVAVPATKTDQLHEYFKQQALQFGDRCITDADEEDILFITEPEDGGSADGRLLLSLVSRMDAAGRAAVRDRLLGLLESDKRREEFARNLSPGMKVSGAFRAPDPRDIRPDCEADCVEIARLRVRLMCKLKWPHALEFMRSTMADTPEGHFADLIPEIDSTLAEFPIVAADPLAV